MGVPPRDAARKKVLLLEDVSALHPYSAVVVQARARIRHWTSKRYIRYSYDSYFAPMRGLDALGSVEHPYLGTQYGAVYP
jgi:hypothetical protein